MDGITTYFDDLPTINFPDGCWAACYGNPADGVDTAFGRTEQEAIQRLKAVIFGE